MTQPHALGRILGFRLTTQSPQTLAEFFERGLGFRVGKQRAISSDEMLTLGLSGEGARIPMTLNGQGVDLDIFTEAGRAYPAGIDAADLRFQHFAFPTPDAAASLERALQAGATLISNGGPVRLPAASGGVIAVKFRDPEGHPMEFLQFATQPAATLAIDHSAISVSHVEASIQFYALRGLKTGGRTLNQGSTQAALDGLERPLVDVVPLLPKVEAPHLELLGYRHPHPTAKDPLRIGDVAATRIVWASEVDALLEDPDGHFHQLSAAE